MLLVDPHALSSTPAATTAAQPDNAKMEGMRIMSRMLQECRDATRVCSGSFARSCTICTSSRDAQSESSRVEQHVVGSGGNTRDLTVEIRMRREREIETKVLKWAGGDSNPGPFACKANALAAELPARPNNSSVVPSCIAGTHAINFVSTSSPFSKVASLVAYDSRRWVSRVLKVCPGTHRTLWSFASIKNCSPVMFIFGGTAKKA